MKKQFAFLAAAALAACVTAGCGGTAGITSVEKTATDGLTDTYTITYSDGSSGSFTVTNGKDGNDGKDGTDGKDGEITAKDAYETYKEIYGEDISYDEFLKKYISADGAGIAKAVNSSLLSSLKVACEFQIYSMSSGGIFGRPTYSLTPAVQQGSAVIYKMDEDYTYAITNYHVIYNDSAQDNKESKKTYVYIYGSEQTPYLDSATNEYSYGDMAIPCEYIGGEISYDIAILKMDTNELKKRNPAAAPVECETRFNVGDTVYTVGNTEGLGIAVNSGVVSVDSEYITLKIDSTARSYRSIRMDAAIHEGNSGGGLFNADGKLIGINNAGSSAASSMNYAIPANIVCGVADNVLSNYDGQTVTGVKKPLLGITVEGKNSRFIYDKTVGYGKITEDVCINAVTEGSIAASLGLAKDDILTSLKVNGKAYELSRFYEIGDLLLTVRAGDKIAIGFSRGGEPSEVEYTVKAEDLQEVE